MTAVTTRSLGGKAPQPAPGVPPSMPTGYLERLHAVVEAELDVAYHDGYVAGVADGFAAGWEEGYAAGFLTPDPPPQGTFTARALERDALRQALWPTADTLTDAIAAFLRDVERRHHRSVTS